MEAFGKLHQASQTPNCTDRYNFQFKYLGMTWNFKVSQTKNQLLQETYVVGIIFTNNEPRTKEQLSNDVGRSLAISIYILVPLSYF